jgi:hypothetical protein
MHESIRSETVGSDGILHIAVPDLTPGQVVEVILREPAPERYRQVGRLRGKIQIANEFDAPLQEMEPYS